MVTLYGHAASRASRNVWLLEEMGTPYKHVAIKVRSADTQKPEYLKLNPSGKLPALVDGDVEMIESLAINLYLGQTYGAGGLWPASKKDQAKTLEWTLWAGTELEPFAIGLLIEAVFKPAAARDEAAIAKLHEQGKGILKILEAGLAKSPYLLGNAFSLADLNVASVLDLLNFSKFDFSPWPKVKAWSEQCFARPAHQKMKELRKAPAA